MSVFKHLALMRCPRNQMPFDQTYDDGGPQ